MGRRAIRLGVTPAGSVAPRGQSMEYKSFWGGEENIQDLFRMFFLNLSQWQKTEILALAQLPHY